MGGLSEADLEEKVEYRNTKNEEFATPLVNILTHVVIHGAYHRGQIARVIGSPEERHRVPTSSPSLASRNRDDTRPLRPERGEHHERARDHRRVEIAGQ